MKHIFSFLIVLVLSLSGNQGYGQLKVVGYLPTWNGYPTSINNVDLTKIDCINIAFANPSSSGVLTTTDGNPAANMATVVAAAHAQNVQVMISIGGANAPGNIYSSLITNNLSGFVTKIVQYTIDNNLDGVDVDLEGDVVDGSTITSTQYENFVTALQTSLHANNKLMTAALATWFGDYITNTAASKFDFINVMSYDAYGTWTGPGQHSSYDMAVTDLDYWHTTKGVPSSKLILGVPFYGYYWGSTNTSYTYSTIVSTYSGAENKDEVFTPSGGVILYNGIPTIKQKTVLAYQQAAGIMIWELTGDATGSKSLLSAIDEVASNYATDLAPSVSISNPLNSASFTEGDTVSIDITSADSDGQIIKTEYYAGTFKIGEQYSTTPQTMKWSGMEGGTYSITVKVTDNDGKSTTSAGVSITVGPAGASLPFTGTALTIPGKIEVENYNLGGNNVGYYDNSAANQGGAYRAGRVDIEECFDTGGGYDIGWTVPGEWLEYSINVTTTGNYTFQSRVATQNSGKFFHVEIDGTNVTGNINVPNTSDWQKWQTVTTNNVALTQGAHKMKIVFNSGDFNINYINTIFSSATAIQESTLENKYTLSPNPVVLQALLRFKLTQSGPTRIELFDNQGRSARLLAEDNMNAGENELMISTSSLPKGIYFCRITGTQEVIGFKMIVE